MRNLYDAAYKSCEVAALPFQAYANYGTLSIDLAYNTIDVKNYKKPWLPTGYMTTTKHP